MAIGYLSIQARTAHDAVPLEGVRITVLDSQGNTIYDLTTDESGQTQPVPLETLDKDFSQNPWFSEVPYISYSVLAQAPGFNTLYISDIPIFDGETATLPVSLEPMLERQQEPSQEAISIGPPAIAVPETRRQEGLLDQSRVLRQVVIPNPITVHLGAPSSSAANVQVPFVDYIKNVASSEIYPTWPDAALRANIYAIITFEIGRAHV